MKKCELCGLPARSYCAADDASLCWCCDAKVHGANFLVARHTRILLCRICQSLTPWKASGPKLGRTVSICEIHKHKEHKSSAKHEELIICCYESDGDNQAPPPSTPPPATSSSSAASSSSSSSNKPLKRTRGSCTDLLQDRLYSKRRHCLSTLRTFEGSNGDGDAVSVDCCLKERRNDREGPVQAAGLLRSVEIRHNYNGELKEGAETVR